MFAPRYSGLEKYVCIFLNHTKQSETALDRARWAFKGKIFLQGLLGQ